MGLRCLVADDHPAVRTAVSEYLAGSGYSIVGPASDGTQAVELAARELPDLGVVDFRMPWLSGVELVRALAEAAPAMRVAVYTGDADGSLVGDVLAAGADAVILKEAPLADLTRALDAMLAGRTYIDPALAPAGSAPAAKPVALTAREVEVLTLLAEGLSHEAIGERLAISSETVRTHARKAAERLNASSRTHAVATALRLGLIA